jgi:hypothetical protein
MLQMLEGGAHRSALNSLATAQSNFKNENGGTFECTGAVSTAGILGNL